MQGFFMMVILLDSHTLLLYSEDSIFAKFRQKQYKSFAIFSYTLPQNLTTQQLCIVCER